LFNDYIIPENYALDLGDAWLYFEKIARSLILFGDLTLLKE
jgi:hypothetical protein